MGSLWCPKCKNENFKEVVVLLKACKRVVPNIRLFPGGHKEASGVVQEVCEAPSESVSYACERCGNTYVLQGSQLVPAWL